MAKTTAEQVGWDYGHNLPPELWHRHPEFKGGGCKRQSPIPIEECVAVTNPDLKTLKTDKYGELTLADFFLEDLHLEIEIHDGDAGGVRFGGGHPYPLKQFHLHAPSEHTLDGQYYSMELHLVHAIQERKSEFETLAVAIFFAATAGAPNNTLLDALISKLPSVHVPPPTMTAKSSANAATTKLTAASAFPSDLSYYLYHGSLTTIPCTEYVQWCILKTPVLVPPEQIEPFGKYFPGGNNRPLQPTNGRLIEKSK